MKRYRHRSPVEAMQWADSDENRERFAQWFESHDAIFETRGPILVLTELHDLSNAENGQITEGEWVVWDGNEFSGVSNEDFVADYEEVG